MEQFAISGVSNDHWTSGEKVTLRYDDAQIENNSDLELYISYNTYGEKQHIVIYANEEIIADYDAMGSEEKEIIIPGSVIDNGKLLLEILLPDAKKPENGDQRKLALWMKKMIIREAIYQQ